MIKTKIKVACNQAIEHVRQKGSYSNNNCYCKPTDINFVVTSKCNLKCKYCYYWKIKNEDRLTIKEWKKIIIDLKKWLGSYHLTISGGEPLLFEGLFDLIRFASENEILVTLVTNGTLIDKCTAKKIVESKVYNLIFSLDGLKKTNDSIRGMGSYDKTISGISILKKLKGTPFLSLATVISNRNLDEITSIVEYVKDAGLNLIYFQPLTFNPKSTYNKKWYIKNAFWPRDIKKVNSIIDQLIVMKNKNYPIANPISQLKLMKNYFKNPTFSTNKCFVGVKNLNIDGAGNVTTCFNMKPIGNVSKTTHHRMVARKTKPCNPPQQSGWFLSTLKNLTMANFWCTRNSKKEFLSVLRKFPYQKKLAFSHQLQNEWKISDIFKNNIKELWYSKKANEIRKKIKNCKRGCSILNCNYTKSPIDKLRRLF